MLLRELQTSTRGENVIRYIGEQRIEKFTNPLSYNGSVSILFSGKRSVFNYWRFRRSRLYRGNDVGATVSSETYFKQVEVSWTLRGIPK